MEELAKQMFPGLQVTSGGYRYLGSFIGLESGKDDFMGDKMENDVRELSTIAATDPQAAYMLYSYMGPPNTECLLQEPLPNVHNLSEHLDWLINETFLPAIIGKEYKTDTMK